jgi:outer membrane lipoprotein-sorting protein
MMRLNVSRRGRWAVPAAAVVITGGVVAGFQVPSAQAVPLLPARTPAELLAMVSSQAKVPAFTGTVVETTSLGLPQLPRQSGSTSITSLLTGSNTIKIYYRDARHFRIAVPQTMSETDFVRDGSALWQWSSAANSATEYLLGAPQAAGKAAMKRAAVPLTPAQAADEVLSAVGKTTTVRTERNVDVAGEAAYQLVLAPKDPRSLIGSVVIAVDGAHGVPLRLQVYARGAAAPAFQIGFTQISYVTPAPGNLRFTPPPGARVRTENLAKGPAGAPRSGMSQQAGSGYGSYGSGWLSVAELPQSALASSLRTGPGSSAAQATPAPAGGSLGADTAGLAQEFLSAARPVSGSWGSGRLLHTSLVNVLMANGEIYAGAVEPSVLYSAAEHGAASGG